MKNEHVISILDSKPLGALNENDLGQIRARGPGPHIAWFKDPGGNILSVLEEK